MQEQEQVHGADAGAYRYMRSQEPGARMSQEQGARSQEPGAGAKTHEPQPRRRSRRSRSRCMQMQVHICSTCRSQKLEARSQVPGARS